MSLRRQIIVNLGSSRVTVAVLSWNSDVLELKEVYFKSINSNQKIKATGISSGKHLNRFAERIKLGFSSGCSAERSTSFKNPSCSKS